MPPKSFFLAIFILLFRLCSSATDSISPMPPKSFFLATFILLFRLCSSATDSISPTQSITGNQTIISKEGLFELGFFTPGDSHNYYIGIWYKSIPGQTVIWVANREIPVSNPHLSVLKISKQGHLLLLNESHIPIWSSSATSTATTITTSANIAVLLDTGNLVLRDAINFSVLNWQSFDHLTDTLVPGGWFGMNKITGEYQSLTPWRNSEDPAPGPYFDTMDPDGSNQYLLLWNSTEPYWSTGVWNGRFFDMIPLANANPLLVTVFVDDNRGRYVISSVIDNRTKSRSVMDSNGQITLWLWMYDVQRWGLIWSAPENHCDVYSVCGSFGICNQNSSILCTCAPGFKPKSTKDWTLNSWSDGCTRNTSLQCSRGHDGFLTMKNIQLPSSPQAPVAVAVDAGECRLACLGDCNCTAYAFTAGKCSIWVNDIRNLQQLSKGETLYLRLASSDLPQYSAPRSSNKRKIMAKIAIAATLGIIILLTLLLLVWKFWWKWSQVRQDGGALLSFTYGEIQRATKNFSTKLGGGSFGSVYKGELALSDSSSPLVVAVKRLEGLREGEKQFRAEVSALSTIQHINLVRLRGFCCQGSKRLLLYDYMQNGSLDHHLFSGTTSTINWSNRYIIIIGIARGLAYIHEKCRECIIHCDIKPENILLDASFSPKLSDFGLAKIFGREHSRVLTTVRGTIGYLAPEWIAGLPITTKADVYSFGMMLFEIISGRRNTEDSTHRFFPIWAATKMIQEDVISLLDENLGGDADLVELNRVCRVALWCIQDSEAQRPSMGLIAQILEGGLEVRMPPIPATLHQLAEYDESGIYSLVPSVSDTVSVSGVSCVADVL